MFFHGGGYCSGSIVSHRRLVTEAGRAAGVRTLAIAYRLAPEHPFPAAYDDVLDGMAFSCGDQNIPAAHIAIGGDSAGAGLTLALIGRLRDAQEELPGCAWLISPWTDLTMSGPTLSSKEAVDPLIHKQYLLELADALILPADDRGDPRVSPLYADLKRLFPHVRIQVGSAETLLDDAHSVGGCRWCGRCPRDSGKIWPQDHSRVASMECSARNQAAARLPAPAHLSGKHL